MEAICQICNHSFDTTIMLWGNRDERVHYEQDAETHPTILDMEITVDLLSSSFPMSMSVTRIARLPI